MAHGEQLDARITEAIAPWGRTKKKKMSDGTCFLIIAVLLWLGA